MTDTFRDLCGELADALDSELDLFGTRHSALLDRARAALAEGVGVGVTPQVDPSDLATALNELLDDIDALVDNSKGVAGLHLNGDVAPWHELLSGGSFEEWLVSVERARNVLESHGLTTNPRPIPVAELQALLSPGYELGDGSMDGAQIVDCEWWHPEMGCDSLQFAVDNCRAIAHPRPIPVADTRYEFAVLDCEDEEQAGGSAATLADAIKEGNHYLALYSNDDGCGPYRLELREVRTLPAAAIPLPEVDK